MSRHLPPPPSSASDLPLSLSGPPPTSSVTIAERLGLAGLTVLPIPNTDIAATVHKYAQERRCQLDQGTSTEETLIFYGATTAHIDAIDRAGKRPGRITFFGEDEAGLLFFRMPRPVHEEGHMHLFLLFWELIIEMGLRRRCRAVAASEYRGTGNGRKKEGDNGIRPNPPRSTSGHFPSLVIEAGNSESLPRLHMDKDWWFDNSPPNSPHGDVRIVILLKFYRPTRKILVEQWYRGQTSASQTVTIMPHPNKQLSLEEEDLQTHWVITGAPMIIPFEDVFLQPTKAAAETDFILTEQDFLEFGLGCWLSDRPL